MGCDESFNCSCCDKTFKDKLELIQHEKTIHPEKKAFSCAHCNKKFKDLGALVIHERIHSKDKPFSCTECDQSFSNSNDLILHERIHSDDKPFSCTKCGKDVDLLVDFWNKEILKVLDNLAPLLKVLGCCKKKVSELN